MPKGKVLGSKFHRMEYWKEKITSIAQSDSLRKAQSKHDKNSVLEDWHQILYVDNLENKIKDILHNYVHIIGILTSIMKSDEMLMAR